MLLDGIKGLLIQTPLRGVLRLKGMSEIQATLSCICGNVSNGYAVKGSSKFRVKLLNVMIQRRVTEQNFF